MGKTVAVKAPKAKSHHFARGATVIIILYPADFQNYLRMDHDIYNELLLLISPLIVKQDTNFRDAITPHERLAATLRYLATGRSYADLKIFYTDKRPVFGPHHPRNLQGHLRDSGTTIPQEIVENYGEHAMSMTQSITISGALGSKTAKQVCKMNQGLDARTQQTMTGTQLELMSSPKSTEE
ncbi:nuclease harbi1-like protein [Plakobranchus ocellatus]|uniref:Nuclease harbi1-like protein n=1 Tax=Plakobranchus ocellatus TaxID=259542 RepID=A0AAV4B6I7_9GAST|nr:nuclease harbi1-like protein [Plakobranchus ocellatus]